MEKREKDRKKKKSVARMKWPADTHVMFLVPIPAKKPCGLQGRKH